MQPVFREDELAILPGREPAVCRRRAAEAAVEDPVVLVQDYHLALAALDGAQAPAAGDDHQLLAYPVAKSRNLHHLPVARQILQGLLGSTILGFQTTAPLSELYRNSRSDA